MREKIIFGIIGAVILGMMGVGEKVTGGAEGGKVAAQEVGSCSEQVLIFVRGTGQALGDRDFASFERAAKEELSKVGVSFEIYELGSRSIVGSQYPAFKPGKVDSVKTYFSAGEATQFGESVREGTRELVLFVRETLRNCPTSKFVLAGYSQGALVVMQALAKIPPKAVEFVATFGDPKLYLPEGKGLLPPACRGESLSRYRYFAPDCQIDTGLLGKNVPYEPRGFEGKIGLWCEMWDVVCGRRINAMDVLGGHTKYAQNGKYQEAMREVARRLRKNKPKLETNGSEQKIGGQTVFLIDSTGSMAGQIYRYKQETERLARKTLEAGGEIGLFEYRDLKADNFATKEHCNFGCNLAEFLQKLEKIKTAGGGDAPESALAGMKFVMNTVNWQKGMNKSLIVLTDADFKAPDDDGTTLEEVVRRSLEIDPVSVFVIGPQRLQERYAKITEQTGGKFFDIAKEVELSTTYIDQRPVADLEFAEYFGAVGERMVFDGRKSRGFEGGKLRYEWDLDMDGRFELAEESGVVEKSYGQATEGFVQMRAVDEMGRSSTMSAKLTVVKNSERNEDAESGLKIEQVDLVSEGVRMKFAGAEQMLVIIDGALFGVSEAKELTVGEIGGAGALVELTPVREGGGRSRATRIRVWRDGRTEVLKEVEDEMGAGGLAESGMGVGAKRLGDEDGVKAGRDNWRQDEILGRDDKRIAVPLVGRGGGDTRGDLIEDLTRGRERLRAPDTGVIE